MDRILAEGATVVAEPKAPEVEPGDAREQLERALARARRLLGRRTAARRAELAVGLQELSESVEAALESLSQDSNDNPV